MNRPNESILYNESDFPMQQRSFAGRQTLNAGRSHRKRTIALCESLWWARAQRRPPRLDHLLNIVYTPPPPLQNRAGYQMRFRQHLCTLRGKRDSFTLKNSREIKYILFSFGSRRPQGFFNLKSVKLILNDLKSCENWFKQFSFPKN